MWWDEQLERRLMGKLNAGFVARAEARQGWRIWDRQQKKWWGAIYQQCPDALLAELNGDKRSEQLMELARRTLRKPG